MLHSIQNTKLFFLKNLRNYFQVSFGYFEAHSFRPKAIFFPENDIRVYETLFCLIENILQKILGILRRVFYQFF